MDIETRKSGKRWIAEVWSDDVSEPLVEQGFKEPYPEEMYTQINEWCKLTFGYNSRTAYHIFEFKTQSDLNWFILRWK